MRRSLVTACIMLRPEPKSEPVVRPVGGNEWTVLAWS